MIGRLMSLVGGLIGYVCIGTVAAQALLLSYFWIAGHLSRDKLVKMTAIAQGADLDAVRSAVLAERERVNNTQLSLEDLARARAARSRDLELREQSLHALIAQATGDQARVVEEAGHYRQVKSSFERELVTLREQALGVSEENARLILENIRPMQAKEQLLRMVSAGEMEGAVVLLSAMPISKRAKVVSEFKTDEEAKTLAEMLKLIREGVPEVTLIDKTRSQLPANATR